MQENDKVTKPTDDMMKHVKSLRMIKIKIYGRISVCSVRKKSLLLIHKKIFNENDGVNRRFITLLKFTSV